MNNFVETMIAVALGGTIALISALAVEELRRRRERKERRYQEVKEACRELLRLSHVDFHTLSSLVGTARTEAFFAHDSRITQAEELIDLFGLPLEIQRNLDGLLDLLWLAPKECPSCEDFEDRVLRWRFEVALACARLRHSTMTHLAGLRGEVVNGSEEDKARTDRIATLAGRLQRIQGDPAADRIRPNSADLAD